MALPHPDRSAIKRGARTALAQDLAYCTHRAGDPNCDCPDTCESCGQWLDECACQDDGTGAGHEPGDDWLTNRRVDGA